MNRPIKVLVVDDSAVMRMHLVRMLESDPQIVVSGAVPDGQAALAFLEENVPSVILMDIHMPGMDGFETARRVMETHPVPIIICTATTNPRDVATTFRVLEAGAVACVEKPASREHADYDRMAANILQNVKLMAEVKVVRRWPKGRIGSGLRAEPPKPRPEGREIRMIAIGASTGGPPVLQTILTGLPKTIAAPILIVQHIAFGFLPGLAEWLDQTTGFRVHIAAYGAQPLPGRVYLAPDGFQAGLSPSGRILLTKEEPENGMRPAVSYLFRSVAAVHGPHAIGVLLTGMGRDGAEELKLMRDKGAVTIAQDRETSVVFGMPGAAIELGAATHVAGAEDIAGLLLAAVGTEKSQEKGP